MAQIGDLTGTSPRLDGPGIRGRRTRRSSMKDWIPYLTDRPMPRLAGMALLIFTLALPATAGATPPALQSVSQSGGRVSATWTLPSGMVLDYIEAGTKPTQTADAGAFPIHD